MKGEAVPAGASLYRGYAAAVDLGSTNLVLSLHDLSSSEELLEIKAENPQIAFGSDILTRMHHAMSGDRGVYDALLEGVNGLLKKACREAAINAGDIRFVVVAGNTAMSHFFLGLDVSTIPVAPFIPPVRRPGFRKASDLSLATAPEAPVYVFPNAGSYVGGDVIAGILASGMTGSEEPVILIDVGTNAEIAIGNRDWILVGAGAAGPALEEGISMIGRRAERGIIYDIEMRNGSVECRTFDDASPEGICGSGMVSLVYEMHRAGIIGDDGGLNPDMSGVERVNGEMEFSFSCGRGDKLTVRQTEIENFLRSKAAMFTLLLVLVRSVGLSFADICRVYVAGALGNGIDVRKAVGIGMLPGWKGDNVVPLGNASLRGAEMLVRDMSLVDKVNSIEEMITYKHMHDDPEFMKEFMGAVFIPHTNPDLLNV